MAVTAVGTLVSATSAVAATTVTISVTTHAVGNCLVLYNKLSVNTQTVTGVSGGNATWVKVAGPTVDTAATLHVHDMWLGTVTTAGTANITITKSSATSATWDRDVQEFTNSNTVTTWARDGSQDGFLDNASSTTITFPTLVPAGSGELYVGHSRCPSGSSYSGMTSGFTLQTDANANPYVYGVVSASTSPTCTDSATDSHSIAAIVIASVPPVRPTITSAGSLVSSTSTTGTNRTFSFTTTAVGNAILLAVETVSSTIQVSSVASTGTVWFNLGVALDTDSPASHDEWWLGIVKSPQASATVTITFTSSVSGIQVDLDAMEFSSGLGPGTVWAVDQFSSRTNASSSTLTWPTLAPKRMPVELYVGRGRVAGTPGAVTPGTFTSVVDADVDPYIYGLISASVSPTQPAGAASITVGTAALVYAYLPPSRVVGQSVQRSSTY